MTFVEPQVIESNHGHFGAQLSAEEGMDIATKDFKYSTREMTDVVFGSSQVQKHVVSMRVAVSFADQFADHDPAHCRCRPEAKREIHKQIKTYAGGVGPTSSAASPG